MRRFTLLLLPAVLFAAQARYARLGEFEGKVEVQLQAADPWMPAERNLPLPESTWLRTAADSRLEIELDEGSVWRMGPNSQSEISDYLRLSTGQRVTLLSLDHGLAYFTGQAEGKDALTLVVPGAQVTLVRGAKVRLEVQDTWSQISVLAGTVRFSSPAAEIDLHAGQTTRVEPANPARFFLDREVPPMELDRWSGDRDKALASTTSAAHVIQRYGLQDLDAAGEWIQTADLGAVWKPKAQDGWKPLQNGRWRWYGTLGYTWVSDDPWGWLPYHYGRWSRRENLGWVWAPANSTVFKPGEVYWLRGPKLAGWGPLAPSEVWNPADPDIGTPQQYLSANTTFAAFEQDAAAIDPAGFTARPKDPLKVAAFALALPSPAFLAARLEATRPELRAGSTRVTPMLDGVTFQNTRTPPIVVINPTPPPPGVVVTESAPPPPPQTVEVPYPVPVYTGIVVLNPPDHPDRSRSGQPPLSKAGPPTASVNPPAGPPKPAPLGTGGQRRPSPPQGALPTHEKKFKKPDEHEVATAAIQEVNNRHFGKALTALDTWTKKYPDSDFKADRLYYYVLAYNGIEQPAKVVDTTTQLLSSGVENTLQDPRQMILTLYLTSLSVQKLPYPSHDQFATGQTAARNLLDFVPTYFTVDNRPAGTSPADWTKAQSDLETTARTTLIALAKRSSTRH
ncbi:MAG: FecR family protein [Acidobacteriia bacterium]|nr:FecR family protein [Terriglobia bacterium]